MLFQLDDLNLSPEAFRLLFSVIRKGYYDKIVTATQTELTDKTGLSKYKLRLAIAELKERKLLQVIKADVGYEITLMPDIVKMINLDFKRKGASQKNMQAKSVTASTSKQEKPKSSVAAPPKPKATPTPKAPPKAQPKPKPTIKQKRKLSQRSDHPPYATAKGYMYRYFEEWLAGHEGLKYHEIQGMEEPMMLKKWEQFREYAHTWLRIQRSVSRPCPDLNKIKFMKKIAIASK
jgi:hypothetical protein